MKRGDSVLEKGDIVKMFRYSVSSICCGAFFMIWVLSIACAFFQIGFPGFGLVGFFGLLILVVLASAVAFVRGEPFKIVTLFLSLPSVIVLFAGYGSLSAYVRVFG